jgi:hypothetical protein
MRLEDNSSQLLNQKKNEMKKLILFACVAALNTAYAQTTTPTTGNSNGSTSNSGNSNGNTSTSGNANVNTPTGVLNSYNRDYPNTNATWTMDGNNYRADYSNNGMNQAAIYDRNGNRLSSERQLSQGSYPSAISDYYTSNYPNEQYNVWSSQDKAGNTTYYVKRNEEMVWFDKNGKYKNKTKIKSSKNSDHSSPTRSNQKNK